MKNANRKGMEESLRESQARLASAIDIAALGFYEMNENYLITYADDRVRAFLGITVEEVPHGREFWLAHIHPDDLPRILDLSRKVLEGGVDRFATEYRYMHPRRGLTWLHHLSHVLVRDAAGKAVRVIGVMQDITERKLTEAARMESMERYKAVIEAFDGFIYICSPDYRVEFMSQSLIRRTGRNAVGESCYKVLHDRDSICEWCVNERVFQGETVRWEVQSPKDHRWYYVVNTPIRHNDGTISKQSMIMDITERKEAEAELLKTYETLRNNQKDLQRLAGKLISAQEEELRRLSRELHDDLTQRLAVLAIEAGKLEQELNSEHGSRSAPSQKISRIKDQLIEVSQNVHHLARQVHPSILDDLGLVRAIESECAVLMKRDNIEIIFRNEDVPISISNDIALCLYRVVQESLRNVITHSRAKNCEILLKGTDSTLCLAVSDNGVGFDPREVRNKPGLGLSSMRERAHLVRGDFSINTRPGKGTAIRVCVSLNGDGA